jgi:hypothetical protein
MLKTIRNKNIFIKKWPVYGLLAAFFCVPFVVIAINSQNEGYRSNAGTTITVDVHDDCHKVVNSSGNDYFIPTGTNNPEWQEFLDATDSLSDLSLEACCEDDPSCAGRSEGDTFCIDSSYRGTCTDTNSDGCLELQSQYCAYGCENGYCESCTVTNTCEYKTCRNGTEIWCVDNCNNWQYLDRDCSLYAGNTFYQLASLYNCTVYENYCTSNGAINDSYAQDYDKYEYTGTCDSGGWGCDYELVEEGVRRYFTCPGSEQAFDTGHIGCDCVTRFDSCSWQ